MADSSINSCQCHKGTLQLPAVYEREGGVEGLQGLDIRNTRAGLLATVLVMMLGVRLCPDHRA